MRTLPTDGGTSTSVWIDADVPQYDSHPEAETGVCIIGAGIAGLTTAFELVRRGTRVTVIDDGPLGGGETGRTTATWHRQSTTATTSSSTSSARAARPWLPRVTRPRSTTSRRWCRLGIECGFRRVDGYLFEPPGDQRAINIEQRGSVATHAYRLARYFLFAHRSSQPRTSSCHSLVFWGLRTQ